MKLTVNEKYLFCREMAMILKSGFSLHQGIMMIGEEIDNSNIKNVLENLVASIDEGCSFSDALKASEAFDEYMINLVNIGETSGNMDTVMASLSDYYFRIDDITDKLKQAMVFPIILLIMMVVVVGVIVFKVLPVFKSVLRSLGSDLTSFANTFMEFGQIFSLICFIILLILVFIIVGVYFYQKAKGINIVSSLMQKSFFGSKLSDSLNKAQITYALSLFVGSGYDLEEAMKYVDKLIDNVKLQEKLVNCNQDLANGEDFVTVIKRYQIYQGMPLSMIQIGFKTGQIDEIMTMLANHFQDEVSEAIGRFLNIIEPSIVAFLSLIVGVVLISVMLPLISIMASI